MPSRPRWDPFVVAAAALVVLGVVLRVSSLGADPVYPYWAGWLLDEGRWTEAAREWALFGAPDLDSRVSRVHLILAPVFQALAGLSFHLFGVGAVQARLPSVVAGLGLLVVAGLFLKDRLPPRPAAGLVALLAVHPDLVYFSRVAIPELPSLFFQFAAFAAVVGSGRTTSRAFSGGLLLALALGMKGTTLLVAPFFVALVPCVAREGDPAGAGRRTAAFLAGLLAPALAFGVALGARPGGAGASVGELLGPFLAVDTLFGIVETPFEGPWTMRVNLVLVATAATGLLVWARGQRPSEARSLFVGAVVWAAGWLTAWALLAYFPERYLVHLHLPLLLALVSGLVLVGEGSRAAGVGSGEGQWKPALASALPAAVVVTPAVLSVADLSGMPSSGLLERLLWMGTLVLAFAAVIRGRGRAAAVGAAVFAAVVGAAWLVSREMGAPIRDFWSVDGVRTTLFWLGLLGLGATATAVLGSQGRLGRIGLARVGAGWAAVLALIWGFEGVRGLTTRTWVVRDVAAWLETAYSPGTLMGSYSVASIFLETPFPYREESGEGALPDVVVVWRGEGDPVLEGYRAVAEFPLDLGRAFFDPRSGGDWVRVFVRGGTTTGSP